MPAKQKQSAKNETKKKDKVIEDKTFGLKNKNRSKAVQKFCATIEQNVKSGGSRDMRKLEAEKEKKKQEKLEKKAKELELKKMYAGVDADKKKEADSQAAAAAAERGEYLWTADDFDEIEEDDTRLEEQLEKEREELVGRTDLTPVNDDTFKAWWENKKKKDAEAAAKMAKKQIKSFKQTGRGISGRALFEHDASIFVDDANADEEYERQEEEDEETEENEKSAEPNANAQDAALFDGEDLPDDDEEA
ncbi:Zinc finger CCCH domain-containing protein 11 [Diplonema papillatum]|nr:Zinc finger CCCH domain-containing protein 11 [Diplonema papillatum]